MTIQQIGIPSEGQVIDVSYLGKVISSVNSMAEQFADLSSTSSVASDVTGDSSIVLTQMLNVSAKAFSVPAETTSVSWQFDRAYRFPPVIVASVEGSADLVYVQRVGISNAVLRFGGAGKASSACNIHAIAIGLFEGT